MLDLTDAVQVFQRHVAQLIGQDVNSSLLLSDIEKGSLIAKFFSKITGFDEKVNRESGWDVGVAGLINSAVEKVVIFLSGDDRNINFEQVKRLCEEIEREAAQVSNGQLHSSTHLPPSDVIRFGVKVVKAVNGLSANDSVYFATSNVNVEIPKGIPLDEDVAQQLLLEYVEENRDLAAVLKVKKPDYLGRSKWSVVYQRNGRTIDVKIQHYTWLDQYQTNSLGDSILPGDCLLAVMLVRCGFGKGGEIVFEDFIVEEVLKVIHSSHEQRGFHGF